MFATRRSARQTSRSQQTRRLNRRSTRHAARFERLEERRLLTADFEAWQFGEGTHDRAPAVAAYDGGIFVAGSTVVDGELDAFIRKFDAVGTEQWTIQLGAGIDNLSIAVDGSGIYVAGSESDGVFVRKYNLAGADEFSPPSLSWSQLQIVRNFFLGSPDIAIDDGGLYITGTIRNDLNPLIGDVSVYAYLRKLDKGDGHTNWHKDDFGELKLREVETIFTNEWTYGSSVAAIDGYVYVAAQTAIDQFTATWDASQAVVRKYDSTTGETVWTERFGLEDLGNRFNEVDDIEIAAGASGVYAFVPSYGVNNETRCTSLRKYDLQDVVDSEGRHHPKVNWTLQFGGSTYLAPGGVTVDGDEIYVVGTASPGTAPADVFVRKFDTAGNQLGSTLFGTESHESADGIALLNGSIYVAGRTDGQFPNNSPLSGTTDAFVAKVNQPLEAPIIETDPVTPVNPPSVVYLSTSVPVHLSQTPGNANGIDPTIQVPFVNDWNDFSDVSRGGTTTGTVLTRGEQTLAIVDAPAPHGVLIFAHSLGGSAPAAILVDGSTIYLDAGESVMVTHGSVELQVLEGPIDTELRNVNGELVATVSLPSGAGAIFDPEAATLVITGTVGNDVFTLTSTGATLNGAEITVTSGLAHFTFEGGGGSDQYDVQGLPPSTFQVPNGVLNDQLTVTSTSDDAANFTDALVTLREAILLANSQTGHDQITFNITTDDPDDPDYDPITGVFTIRLSTALPVITDSVTIDGYSQSGATENTNAAGQGTNAVLKIELKRGEISTAGTGLEVAEGSGSVIKGLAINSFTFGITLRGPSSETVISGNFIGTNAAGTEARPNVIGIATAGSLTGLFNTFDNQVEGNLISGNSSFGILVGAQLFHFPEQATVDTLVLGNYIGTDATGQQAVPNGVGVALNSADNSRVGGALAGQANVIAFNTSAGVSIGSSGGGYIGHGNTVRGNSIVGNAGLGIDLSTNLSSADGVVTQNTGQFIATVTNGHQNFPELQIAVEGMSTRILGTLHIEALDVRPNPALYTIDVYANAANARQGQRYLGAFDVSVDASGTASFDEQMPWATQTGEYLTATATDAAGNTSEFSTPMLLTGDADGDGIANPVDTQPITYSNDFSDLGTGGTTTGAIVSRGDQIITIVDAANPDGVTITTDPAGGAMPAMVSVDAATYEFGPGVTYTTTKGSVITDVAAGIVATTFLAPDGQIVATSNLAAGTTLTFEPETVTFVAATTNEETAVEIVFVGADGQQATTDLSAGNEISFNPDSFFFTAGADNTLAVEVIVNGTTLSVAPGSSVQPVQIDIKPDVGMSSINLDSNGVIAVAILSSATFDASDVIASTVLFAGANVSQSALQDVNGDGRLDLVLNFRTQDTTLRSLYELLLADDLDGDGVLDTSHQTASVSLSGETVDEVLIEGFDSLDLFLAGRSLRELLEDLAESGAI